MPQSLISNKPNFCTWDIVDIANFWHLELSFMWDVFVWDMFVWEEAMFIWNETICDHFVAL